jgi:hypothetical protein
MYVEQVLHVLPLLILLCILSSLLSQCNVRLRISFFVYKAPGLGSSLTSLKRSLNLPYPTT